MQAFDPDVCHNNKAVFAWGEKGLVVIDGSAVAETRHDEA